MFDLLTNSLDHPLLMLFDVKIKQETVVSSLIFISMGLREGMVFELVDKRNIKVCSIKIPSFLSGMPRDVGLTIDCPLQIIHWF